MRRVAWHVHDLYVFVIADCIESGCGGTWFMLDDDVESIFGSKEGFHVDIPHRVIVMG